LKQPGTSSKYKGVSWAKKSAVWLASIRYKGKQIHLGLFLDEKLAARAYDEVASKLHGEFAQTNFPPPHS
jgi:hypothetical protein